MCSLGRYVASWKYIMMACRIFDSIFKFQISNRTYFSNVPFVSLIIMLMIMISSVNEVFVGFWSFWTSSSHLVKYISKFFSSKFGLNINQPTILECEGLLKDNFVGFQFSDSCEEDSRRRIAENDSVYKRVANCSRIAFIFGPDRSKDRPSGISRFFSIFPMAETKLRFIKMR